MYLKLMYRGELNMKSISNIISHLLTAAFGIIVMPLFILLVIVCPIMTICDAFKIISTGYTVTGAYIGLVMMMAMTMYFSLRIRAFRRIYVIFPSLYEFLKYLTMSYVFIGIGTEILNWSYMELTSSRKLLGIAAFIISIILWRVFVSVYYAKKPISKVMLQKDEKLQNYNAKLN